MVRYHRREGRNKEERNDEKTGEKNTGKEFERKKESSCKFVVCVV
jgi:hypothetical protein